MQGYMPVEYNNGVSTVSIVLINLKRQKEFDSDSVSQMCDQPI